MKCVALGLSTASIVLLLALEGAAQDAAPPTQATDPAPTPPAPTTTEAPAQPPQPPAGTAPNPATPNPTPSPTPATQPPPTPTSPYPPYSYPPYGYRAPYGGSGWGMPEEPPREMAYDGRGIPRGYKLEERYNIGLLIAGPTLFALGYAIAAFTASDKIGAYEVDGSVGRRPWNTLYIPITGPLAFSAYAPQGSSFIYIFEGLAQVCGVGLFLGGLLRTKEILVRKNTLEAFHPTLRVGPRAMQLEMRF